MQLNDFVAAYIPQRYRGIFDYESGAGWYHQVNRLLFKLERKGLFNTTKKIERAIEVDNLYWITVPTDLRRLMKIYDPFNVNTIYSFDYLNGKIRLTRQFTKDESPDEFTLSSGSTTTIEINDADATADQWNDYVLVLTDGTYSGNVIQISDSAAAGGGVAELTFKHTQPGAIDSTAGYLTKTYLMLEYKTIFVQMSAYNGEIPIDDRYEDLLINWLIMSTISKTDKSYPEYKRLFEDDFDEAVLEQNTATPDQLRPEPIFMPEANTARSPTYSLDGSGTWGTPYV